MTTLWREFKKDAKFLLRYFLDEKWILESRDWEYDAGGNGRTARWLRVSGVYDIVEPLPLKEAIEKIADLYMDNPEGQYRLRKRWSREIIPAEALGL